MPTDESLPSLAPSLINVLIVLMAEGRDLSNNELKALAGSTLTGKEKDKLVQLGFVKSYRTGRMFSHELADAGAKYVRALPTSELSGRTSAATLTLLTLLRNVQRGLARTPMKSYGEFFSQAAGKAETPPATSVETQIRAAYAELAKTPGDWVALADLRQQLGSVDRASLDSALLALLDQEGVRIIPVANTKALQPRDRAAALRIGDEDNHALAIGAV